MNKTTHDEHMKRHMNSTHDAVSNVSVFIYSYVDILPVQLKFYIYPKYMLNLKKKKERLYDFMNRKMSL